MLSFDAVIKQMLGGRDDLSDQERAALSYALKLMRLHATRRMKPKERIKWEWR